MPPSEISPPEIWSENNRKVSITKDFAPLKKIHGRKPVAMSLILHQTKLEASPPKDVGEQAFLVEADALHQMLGFCHNNFSPIADMALVLDIWNPSEETFPNMYTFNPPPPIYGQIYEKRVATHKF